VCVLRERGQPEEAERLRAGELMTMLASVRTPTESDAAISERLNAIFAAESERVANAAVLCELLLPLLSEKASLPAKTSAPPVAVAIEPALAAAPSEPIPEKPAAPRAASIADFIDEMIAQEKPPPRSGGNTQRRAS
jgi:hypothetical protein